MSIMSENSGVRGPIDVSGGARSAIDHHKLSMVLGGIGVVGILAAFIWWLTFYLDVGKGTDFGPGDAVQCLFVTVGQCVVVKRIAGAYGSIAYEPILLWVSAALLLVAWRIRSSISGGASPLEASEKSSKALLSYSHPQFLKAPQDLAAGLFLIALAFFALWLGSSLNPGTLRQMGPGMLPRAVAVLIALTGFGLIAMSFISDGPKIGFVAIRGPLFITLGILCFGLTIRGFQIPLPCSIGVQPYFALPLPWCGVTIPTPALGLLGAGPLAILISGFASKETKWKELVIFAVCMTTFCLLLFKGISLPNSAGGWTTYGLNLPIPLAPWLLGY